MTNDADRAHYECEFYEPPTRVNRLAGWCEKVKHPVPACAFIEDCEYFKKLGGSDAKKV
jgi:hypothetical protein